MGILVPTGPREMVRMMAISAMPAIANRDKWNQSPGSCDPVRDQIGGYVSSQAAHHNAGSQAVLARCRVGSAARQISPMSWNGIHRLAMGTSQPQKVQARARR